MLRRLIINDIALINKLDIELARGFNVLTGETGAGKSIIIDSVNLVLGERANKEIIASGKQKARVEAFFDIGTEPTEDTARLFELLDEMGIDCSEGELVIVREITTAGKSLVRLNGEIITLNALKSITETLVDVHGQHEHQSLLDSKKHIKILDAFAAETVEPLKQKVAHLSEEYRDITKKLNAGFVSAEERERRLDIIAYQMREIDAAEPKAGEEEAIEEEVKLLSNAEKINSALENASVKLSADGGALDKLRACVDALGDISELSEQYSELYERMNNAFYEIEDASYQLREQRFAFEYSPDRLNELETRLDLIASLKRKYGGSVEKVLEFRAELQSEFDALTGADELRTALEKQKAHIIAEYALEANALTEARKSAAKRLEAGVDGELKQLGMPNAVFKTAFNTVSEIRHGGADEVEFMFTANAGEDIKPLSKVASGGETARVMLAIKTVCAAYDSIPTLIFDEVDAGISGTTATKVGERLSIVSRSKQVLSVTHLPQIAAFADEHLFVEKNVSDGRTTTALRTLDPNERGAELARIMGDADSDGTAAKYASEMISRANAFKKEL